MPPATKVDMETLVMMHVQKKKHRVHSLTGRITSETLRKAFKNVKKNRGAAGIDKQTIQMDEANLTEESAGAHESA